MTTDLDLAYSRWIREESSASGLPPEETSIAQMLDHGSISFGRYAVESLSWEKWSVFTHDRNQEELDKFKAPGLVAKKKAYFEEYYKKLRILKAVADEHKQTDVEYGSDGTNFNETAEKNQLGSHFRIGMSRATTTYGGLVDLSRGQLEDANGSSLTAGCDSEGTVSSFDSTSGISDDIYLDRSSTNISQLTHLNSALSTPCLGSPKDSLHEVYLENMASDASQITQLDSEALLPCHGLIEGNLGVICMNLNGFENDCSILKSLEKTHDTDQLRKGVSDNKEPALSKGGAYGTHTHAFKCCGNSRVSYADPKMSRKSVSCFKTGTGHLTDSESVVSKKIHEHDPCLKSAGVFVKTYRDPKTPTKSDPAKLFCRTSYLHVPIKKGENIASPSKLVNTGKLKNDRMPSPSKVKVCSSVTVPRPFSFATERRAIIDRRPTASISREHGEVHLNQKLKDEKRAKGSLHAKSISSLQDISKSNCTNDCTLKRTDLEKRPGDVVIGKFSTDKDRTQGRMQRKPLAPSIGKRDQLLSKQKLRSMGNRVSAKQSMNGKRDTADLNGAEVTLGENAKGLPSSSSNQIVKVKTSRQELRRWR